MTTGPIDPQAAALAACRHELGECLDLLQKAYATMTELAPGMAHITPAPDFGLINDTMCDVAAKLASAKGRQP